MKYATYKWNVRVTINGKTGVPYYYGYKTKAQAEDIAQRYRAAGYEAEVVKY